MSSKQDIDKIEIEVEYQTVQTGYAQDFRKTINDNFALTKDYIVELENETNDNFDKVDANIDDLQKQIGETLKHNTDYITLQEQLGDTKGATAGKLISIQEQLGNTKTTKDSEGKVNNSIQEQINVLDKKVDDNKNDLTVKINEVDTRLTSSINSLTETVSTNNINHNNTEVNLQTQINNLSAAISGATGDITELIDRIEEDESTINENSSNIISLNSTVSSHTSNISSINTKIGDVGDRSLQDQIGSVPAGKTLQEQIDAIDPSGESDFNYIYVQKDEPVGVEHKRGVDLWFEIIEKLES